MLGAEARTFNLFPRCWREARCQIPQADLPELLTSAVILWGPAVVKPLILE